MTRLLLALGLCMAAIVPASAQRSPAPLSAHQGPGSGNAFGLGIVYTVQRHAEYNGKQMVVCISNEPGVQIWSPIPKLVQLHDGARFTLREADSLEQGLTILGN